MPDNTSSASSDRNSIGFSVNHTRRSSLNRNLVEQYDSASWKQQPSFENMFGNTKSTLDFLEEDPNWEFPREKLEKVLLYLLINGF